MCAKLTRKRSAAVAAYGTAARALGACGHFVRDALAADDAAAGTRHATGPFAAALLEAVANTRAELAGGAAAGIVIKDEAAVPASDARGKGKAAADKGKGKAAAGAPTATPLPTLTPAQLRDRADADLSVQLELKTRVKEVVKAGGDGGGGGGGGRRRRRRPQVGRIPPNLGDRDRGRLPPALRLHPAPGRPDG